MDACGSGVYSNGLAWTGFQLAALFTTIAIASTYVCMFRGIAPLGEEVIRNCASTAMAYLERNRTAGDGQCTCSTFAGLSPILFHLVNLIASHLCQSDVLEPMDRKTPSSRTPPPGIFIQTGIDELSGRTALQSPIFRDDPFPEDTCMATLPVSSSLNVDTNAINPARMSGETQLYSKRCKPSSRRLCFEVAYLISRVKDEPAFAQHVRDSLESLNVCSQDPPEQLVQAVASPDFKPLLALRSSRQMAAARLFDSQAAAPSISCEYEVHPPPSKPRFKLPVIDDDCVDRIIASRRAAGLSVPPTPTTTFQPPNHVYLRIGDGD